MQAAKITKHSPDAYICLIKVSLKSIMKVSDQQNHMKALKKPPVQLQPKKEIEKYLLDFYHPHLFEIPWRKPFFTE